MTRLFLASLVGSSLLAILSVDTEPAHADSCPSPPPPCVCPADDNTAAVVTGDVAWNENSQAFEVSVDSMWWRYDLRDEPFRVEAGDVIKVDAWFVSGRERALIRFAESEGPLGQKGELEITSIFGMDEHDIVECSDDGVQHYLPAFVVARASISSDCEASLGFRREPRCEASLFCSARGNSKGSMLALLLILAALGVVCRFTRSPTALS